jgi:hypothetical protein
MVKERELARSITELDDNEGRKKTNITHISSLINIPEGHSYPER